MQNASVNPWAEFEGSLTLHPSVSEDAAVRHETPISLVTDPVKWLGEAIEQGINTLSYNPVEIPKAITDVLGDVSISDLFVATARVAVGASILNVNGSRVRIDKANFEYISLQFPLMDEYKIYHNAENAYDIVPVVCKEDLDELKTMKCLVNGNFVVPDWYPQAMLFFRRFGLMTGYGLPKDKYTDDPSIYQLTTEDGVIRGLPGHSVHKVMVAAALTSAKLTDLFGSYRIYYCGIHTLRSTFETIGLKALHALGR